jgi:pleiotropic regulator 1
MALEGHLRRSFNAAMLQHSMQFSFVSANEDAVIKWSDEDCNLFKIFDADLWIVESLVINRGDFLVIAGDDGTMRMRSSGSWSCFQEPKAIPHPGSLPSKYGIFDCAFCFTKAGLITCEVNKTIKLCRESKDDRQRS